MACRPPACAISPRRSRSRWRGRKAVASGTLTAINMRIFIVGLGRAVRPFPSEDRRRAARAGRPGADQRLALRGPGRGHRVHAAAFRLAGLAIQPLGRGRQSLRLALCPHRDRPPARSGVQPDLSRIARRDRMRADAGRRRRPERRLAQRLRCRPVDEGGAIQRPRRRRNGSRAGRCRRPPRRAGNHHERPDRDAAAPASMRGCGSSRTRPARS